MLLAGGATRDVRSCGNALVVALDPLTGAQVWSRTFDGTLVAKTCHVDAEAEGPGPPIDDDEFGAMAIDAEGRLLVGLALVNRTATGVHTMGSIRRVTVRR